MADNVISLSSPGGRPVDHVGHGPVMPDEIEIGGREIVDAMAKIADHGQRL